MKKISLCLASLVFASASQAAVFWTVKANSIIANTSGSVGVNIGTNIPTGPNPAGTTWEPCHQNWIYFHKKADGTWVDEKHIDRMISIAIAAIKTETEIRFHIDRDGNNKCYTSQIFS